MESLKQKLSKNPIKSDLRSLLDLKIILDDLLSSYLTATNKFTRSYFLVDLRIAIGIISTICSLVVVYFSLYHEFVFYKPYVTWLLSIYFGLNISLECYFYFFKNPVFSGRNKKSKTIKVFTAIKSPDTKYYIDYYNDKVKKSHTIEMTEVFGDKGTLFHEKCFEIFDDIFDIK
ncbi:hypothetical protein H311_03512 [Anncaliia algerae PRA109]|nr:hypothetical protein H311_03512 [Anncaliia algerae PRA109]